MDSQGKSIQNKLFWNAGVGKLICWEIEAMGQEDGQRRWWGFDLILEMEVGKISKKGK